MIRVEELSKRYDGVDALKNVSFTVQPGEIFGFVGPNGAGKTTSLKILATLLQPSAGAAFIDGREVTADPYTVRGRIGYMPDFFGVYDLLSTAEYLAFYASCYGIPRTRHGKIITDLLQLIGLEAKRDAMVDTLSRGMKQRLCLARALVHDPLVLLLDEPASGLDPRARVEMRELLKELQRMGKTIVISSHILPELTELCSSFGIIDRGRMVATGTLEALMSQQGAPRTRVTVRGDAAAAARRAQALPGVRGVTFQDTTLEVEYEGGEENAARLLRALVLADVEVVAFTPLQGDLEATFLRMTHEGVAS
jgi:ABC-2 type transport system ATP-binding protein